MMNTKTRSVFEKRITIFYPKHRRLYVFKVLNIHTEERDVCEKSLSLTTESRVVVKLLLKFQTKNLSVSPARTAKMKCDETKERRGLVSNLN